jgi:hypothetical protein
MTTALYIILGVYLGLGLLFSFCLTALGVGVSGRLVEGKDILFFIGFTVGWLPYISWKLLCFAMIFVVPMGLQNKLGILSGRQY